ncbi:apurinic/apyrimidinic endonuclease family protein [Herbidospora sp. RD11066]
MLKKKKTKPKKPVQATPQPKPEPMQEDHGLLRLLPLAVGAPALEIGDFTAPPGLPVPSTPAMQEEELVLPDFLPDGPIEIQAPAPAPAHLMLVQKEVPFTGLGHLREFVTRERGAVQSLLAALTTGTAAERQVAKMLVDEARKVIPDPPIDLALADDGTEADFWALAGRALNVAAVEPIAILAEIAAMSAWLKTPEGTPGVTATIHNAVGQARGKKFVVEVFRPMVQGLLDQSPFRQVPTARPASMRNEPVRPNYKGVQKLAGDWIAAMVGNLKQGELGDSYPEQLKQMAKRKDLAGDRSMDRLADMVYCLGRGRICVAILRRGRDIGVFANTSSDKMGLDFDRLLQASRLSGERRNTAINDLVREMLVPGRDQPQDYADIRNRLVKALDYLAELEATHGRLRTNAFKNTVRDMHAEMQAAAVAENSGSDALGISKACCLTCWIILTQGKPELFGRTFATHLQSYPWPPGQMVADPDVLIKILDLDADPPHLPGDAAALLRAAIKTGPKGAVLLALYQIASKGGDTGYLSSGDEADTVDIDPHAVAYQAYLDEKGLAKTKRKEAPVVVTPPTKKPKT